MLIITFSITDKALEWLVDKGFDQEYGARPLKRAIQKYIQNPIDLSADDLRVLNDNYKEFRAKKCAELLNPYQL